MSRIWIRTALAVAFVPAVMIFAARDATANDKLVIALAGTGLQYSTLDIAMQGGFFKQEGFDPEVVDLQSGPRQIAAIMGGSADVSISGMVQVVKAHAKGDDQLVAITSFQTGVDLAVVLSNAALAKTGIELTMPIDEKVKRLHGVRIGITSPGGSTDVLLRTLFKKRGLDADKEVQIQPLGGGNDMLAALEKGATDGFVWGAPQAQYVEVNKLGKIAISPSEIPEIQGMPYQGIVVTRDALKKRPDYYRRVALAITNALQFAQSNEAKSKDYVQSQFPNIDKAIFDSAWPSYYKLIPTSPVISPEQIDTTIKWLSYTSDEPLAMKYTDLVYPEYAEQAEKQVAGK